MFGEGVETPIHELGHIWSGIMNEANPRLWNDMINVLKDSPYFAEQEARLKRSGYALEKDSEAYHDEILAGAIGKRGAELFQDAEQQRLWDKIVERMFDFIDKTLGTNLSGKRLSELTGQQLLDAAVKELSLIHISEPTRPY